MTTYVATQAVNILILLGFGLLLLLRTRAEVNRRLAQFAVPFTENERERVKLELQNRIQMLQHELEVLENVSNPPTASALRSSEEVPPPS
jgi:signal transduction histidine kinase